MTLYSGLFLVIFLSLFSSVGVASSENDRDIVLPDKLGHSVKIEVCFVLDTTGSMSGLIEGSKKKIWSIANRILAETDDLALSAEVHFSLVGYRDKGDEYVTLVTDLTQDIDSISKSLRAFSAGGGGDGPESVNRALYDSVYNISWSDQTRADQYLAQIIVLVGDFPPHMDYEEQQYPITIKHAVTKGIVVNAIQAGSYQPTTPIWKDIARLGGGAFSQILQDGNMKTLATHFDQDLVALNIKLGRTLLPYGVEKSQKELMDVQNSSEAMSEEEISDRASFLARKKRIVMGSGDLVYDLQNGLIQLEDISEDHLPKKVRGLSREEQLKLVEKLHLERKEIQKVILRLAKYRERELATKNVDSAFDQQVVNQVKEMLNTND